MTEVKAKSSNNTWIFVTIGIVVALVLCCCVSFVLVAMNGEGIANYIDRKSIERLDY